MLAVFLVIDMLRDDRDKHRPPKENRFIVEELPKQTRQADLSAPAGTWQKRIRKQYRQLISGRADPEDLSPLSPRELEAFTGLPDSEDRRTLHGLYEQARYSSLPCTREDYRAAKAAAKALAAERRAAKP